MRALHVEVWSDIACPWCYVGKRRLEAAVARLPEGERVEVRWRSFELDPGAPRVSEPDLPYAERLARKYRCSVAEGEAMIRRMTETAARDGLELRFDRIRPGNTFDAHRLLHLAAEAGRGDELEERLLRAYLTEGEAIGDVEVLARLAVEAGLPEPAARAVLEGDVYGEAVRADEAAASALGITGVPFFRIGHRSGLAGAQPAQVLLAALEEARVEVRDGGELPRSIRGSPGRKPLSARRDG